jgi:hypothetical protein
MVWYRGRFGGIGAGESPGAQLQVTASLRYVDTAYASSNAAEAQSKFEEAKSNWDKVSPMISAREAREAQLLFDSLGNKLKNSAPPAQIKSTVSGMLEEFNDDIERELRWPRRETRAFVARARGPAPSLSAIRLGSAGDRRGNPCSRIFSQARFNFARAKCCPAMRLQVPQLSSSS